MEKRIVSTMIKIALLGGISLLGAIPLATWTEPFLTAPVQQGLAFVQNHGLPLHPLDEKGVPQVYYFRLGRAFDNPVYVCIYAYGYYQLWKGSHEYDYFLKHYVFRPPYKATPDQYQECFFSCADWLMAHLKSREFQGGTFYVWEYSFPWEVYNLEPPWVSGMAQGCGMEVLVRAYQESGESKYLQAAQKALTAFFVPVEGGGVVRKDSEDAWWYEEYASAGARDSRVLNGMAHALIGIYHYWKETKDPKAAELLQKGLRSLKQALPKYDTGQWTYYDQLGQIAKLKYHCININTIERLGELTGERFLVDTAQRWKTYRSSYFTRYFIWQRPPRFYLFLLIVNIGITAVLITSVYYGMKHFWKYRKIARRTASCQSQGARG